LTLARPLALIGQLQSLLVHLPFYFPYLGVFSLSGTNRT
jgi:hypothetical protein